MNQNASGEASSPIPLTVAIDPKINRIAILLKSYSVLGVLSVIWGLAFVAIKATEPLLTPVNLTLLRWFLASLGFLALAPFLGRLRKPFERRDLPRFLLVAFSIVVAYHLTLNYSESSVSAGLAVLLVSLGPVFIIVLSRIFLKEHHGREVVYAVALAFAGAVILSFGSELTHGGGTTVGILEAVGTAFSFSVSTVFSKPLVQKYGPIQVTIWSGLLGTVMLLPLISQGFVVQVSRMPISGWIAMLYLSLVSTVMGYMLFYTLVNRGSLARLSIQLYLIPVVGVAGGILILGETLTYFTIIGGGAMLLSVAYATRAGKRAQSEPTPAK